MRNNKEEVIFVQHGEMLDDRAATGVSLHCHTLYSKELLDFVPYYAARIPIASFFWQLCMDRLVKRNGATPDFTTGHWTPPLDGRKVFDAELTNLAGLGLKGMVSITDHDSIGANLDLRHVTEARSVPISLEWTVPFENAFFHLGVHNLPIERAEIITKDLLEYTYAGGLPNNARLHELLSMLNDLPNVLVVLNHPMWDIERIGQYEHERSLTRFVACHLKKLNAIEINGFRAWAENQSAMNLAESLGLPLISGGDRHCCQPNTILNFTNASSFDEFVYEIRHDGRSRIAITPEYNAPLPSRQLRSIAQILHDYENFEERRLWSDRVFLDYRDGNGMRTLTEAWNGARPFWTYPALYILSLLAHRRTESFLSLIVGDNDIGREDHVEAPEIYMTGNAHLMAE